MTQSLNTSDEKIFTDFFYEAADLADQIALRYFRQVIPVDEKQDKSPVTAADREIEEKIRALISERFPEHGIIGEEFGRQNEGRDYVWVIDPIDGTKSFATGRPLFGTIIGLMHEGVPLMGLIDQPFTKERWFGLMEKYALYNGTPVKVAKERSLKNSRLYTGSLDMFKGDNFENYLKLCRSSKWTQYSCDCYAYGLLSMGWVDLVVEQCLGLHDVIGVAPIITGAGGFMSNWQGKPINKDFTGEAIAASSHQLAEEAMQLMSRQ